MNANEETKQAFQDRIEAEIKERRADLDKMKAKMEQAEAEARIGFDENLRTLQQQLDAAQVKLDHFRESGGEGWKELKTGMASAVDELDHAFQKAKREIQSPGQ